MDRVSRVALAGLVAVSVAWGCARQTKTVRTEATVRYPVDTTQRTTEDVVVEKQTITTTTSVPSRQPRGVLSTAIHVVGEIFALPFRLIGGLIRLIF